MIRSPETGATDARILAHFPIVPFFGRNRNCARRRLSARTGRGGAYTMGRKLNSWKRSIMSDETVPVSLSLNEAIVLFEFLSRNVKNRDLRIEHEAERTVLSDLLCTLERQLNAPLAPNYSEVLAEARRSLKR